jgi:hypothetical protein
MTEVIHQSAGFFDTSQQPSSAILPLQAVPSDPTLPTLNSTTGLLSPDQATAQRMQHFPETLYDLSPQSHLVRFARALLGDSGAGQLRTRYTVARLQTTLGGTHFYDLDGFYGALFGAQRRVEEQLPINPMYQTAEPDEWDDIDTSDARYRERLYALAQSLPMAGTVPGLQQAAEALTGVECDVYETWRLIEAGGKSTLGRTYDQVQADFTSWDTFEVTKETWNSVSGRVQIGRSGADNRDEVYIRPKRDYTPVDGTQEAYREAERQRLEDEMAIQRVLNRLKPAGVLLTVDNQGLALHIPAQIAGLVADSNFWEVVTKVQPRPGLNTDPDSTPYPVSPVKVSTGVVTDGVLAPLPVPPFHNSQGNQWSYNTSITSVNAYAVSAEDTVVDGDTDGLITDRQDWEKVLTGTGASATVTEYRPARGITDQRALLAAQASADSVLMAHPYSGPRTVVPTHG